MEINNFIKDDEQLVFQSEKKYFRTIISYVVTFVIITGLCVLLNFIVIAGVSQSFLPSFFLLILPFMFGAAGIGALIDLIMLIIRLVRIPELQYFYTDKRLYIKKGDTYDSLGLETIDRAVNSAYFVSVCLKTGKKNIYVSNNITKKYVDALNSQIAKRKAAVKAELKAELTLDPTPPASA